FVEGLTNARPERGVFSSKNSFGTAMVILWLTALCSSLDTGLPRWFRLCAAGAALLGLYLIHVSNSATATLLGLAGFLIIMVLLMRNLVTFFAMVFVLVWLLAISATLGAMVAFTVPNFNPLEQILGLFGKDTTLTGRTVLWQYAFDQIRQDPLFGVGVGGFWTPQDGFSTARRIYADFHKESHASFSFHNAFIEIAVHQGLIGLGLVLTAIAWCLWRITIAAIFDTSTPAVFFVCLSLILLARSLTEIGLLAPFNLLSMLFIIGTLFAIKRGYVPKQGVIAGNAQSVS
ncbi:MAG: O-antigen ligase family protein, partial [Pseudomonadota bacterium]